MPQIAPHQEQYDNEISRNFPLDRQIITRNGYGSLQDSNCGNEFKATEAEPYFFSKYKT